ncbi:27 kDa hemolymph protein-like [Prorops nasuta]|uniref:27 kDa hemolymph protein-like n=1 Tax=Prorops nasuta TaxID=863751 RepID=UPI0034CDBED3
MRCCIAVILFMGLISHSPAQQSIPEVQDILNKVPELNLDASAIPSIEEASNLFKQKCDKNGGPQAFDKAKVAQKDLETCVRSLINVTELQDEMEKAKPTGELDTVFKKYCQKAPILKGCVTNFTNEIDACLEEKEKETKRIIWNVTESLLEFVCFKEGDRIALFISAGGPECFQDKQQDIQDCLNSTFGHYIPQPNPNGGVPSLESLPTLVYTEQGCTDMKKLQNCTVQKLEGCKDPTPANIVDSIFNFIIRSTPCQNLITARFAAATGEAVTGGAAGTSVATEFGSIITLLLVYLSIKFL